MPDPDPAVVEVSVVGVAPLHIDCVFPIAPTVTTAFTVTTTEEVAKAACCVSMPPVAKSPDATEQMGSKTISSNAKSFPFAIVFWFCKSNSAVVLVPEFQL